MNQKLKTILLIDDNAPTNFVNKLVIEETGCASSVVTLESASEALDYLRSAVDDQGQFPKPELIFLDINMPAMNGWEFLDAYQELEDPQRADVVIIMLSTSLNPDDAEKAAAHPLVNGYQKKPLTVDELKALLKRHFGF